MVGSRRFETLQLLGLEIDFSAAGEMELDEFHVDRERILPLTVGQRRPLRFLRAYGR